MDPIHGFINIAEFPVIEELTDSRYFQRLRRLTQLGAASAAYPGAVHSRFSHSLGVMHIFVRLYNAINRNESVPDFENKRITGATAALLHDIGHGPFSHASEAILDRNAGGFSHEDMSCRIIRETEIADILARHGVDPDSVCDIINHIDTPEWRLISQLISSQLDADRLDYLMRDSYYTGVNYGRIDLHRIATTVEVWHGGSDDPFNGTAIIHPKGIGAIENYILGRHLMYEGVYYHKLTRCMELLFHKVFWRAAEMDDAKTGLSAVMNIDSKTTPEQLYGMDDYSCTALFHRWTKSDDEILRDLATRILDRRRLASIELTIQKYTNLGAEKISRLPQMVQDAGYSREYYYIEDRYQKSAYDTYDPNELEEGGFSPIGHIMTPSDGRLQEISRQSSVIQTLSQIENKKIRIFLPDDVKPEAERLVSG